jgi:Ser/Thr protein kinase RdoA (MazF antagonist)
MIWRSPMRHGVFRPMGRVSMPRSRPRCWGYEAVRPLGEERAALPVLARGAAMRFLATRAYDWINTPMRWW